MSAALRLWRLAGRAGTALRLPELALRGRPAELRERRGECPPGGDPPPLWLHAASLGELVAAEAYLRALRSEDPGGGDGEPVRVALSAMSRTGRARAVALSPDVGPFHPPLDAPGPVARCLERLRPASLVVLETELWPTLLTELTARGVPWAIASGRLTERGLHRMGRAGGLYRELLDRATAVAARTEGDAARFRALGARPEAVAVTGDLKEDRPPAPPTPLPPGPPVWIAACTRPGEESLVLAALGRVERDVPGGQLLLAPRHPERFAEARRLAQATGRSVRGWAERDDPAPPGWSIVLVDAMGVLGEAYRRSHVAFVGGSLVPLGGHSPLEAAACARPVVMGPHDRNCREAARALEIAGGLVRATDEESLAAAVLDLLRDPGEATRRGRAAHALVQARSGSAARTLAFLRARGIRT